MINFFKHKATASAEATSNPEPVTRVIPDSIGRSATSINDELIRVEEKWQNRVLVVSADLPGVDPDRDIRLTVVDRHLVIEAERRQRDTINEDGHVIDDASCAMFMRTLPIREGVDASAITATYRDGVLEVRVPMPTEASGEPAMRIPVTT